MLSKLDTLHTKYKYMKITKIYFTLTNLTRNYVGSDEILKNRYSATHATIQ